jgi:translation initiation factor 5B
MQLITDKEILPGMPFTTFKDNLEEIKKEFKKEISEKLKTDKKGIIIKADSLGSLEALITMLKQERIPIIKAGIGKINKKDIISAQTTLKNDPENAIILGFSTEEDDDVKEMTKEKSNIKIIKNEVIYKLIEDLTKYQEEKRNEIKREKLTALTSVCKLTILHQYIFRNNNPAVFGIRVEAGKITPNTPLMNAEGESIAKIKDVQDKQTKLKQATMGQEIAISLPGINFERQLQDTQTLYSDLSENQFKQFKENKDLLTQDEIQTLQKIAQIKRAKNTTWGV